MTRSVGVYRVWAKATAKYTYDGLDVILDEGSEGIVKYQNGLGIDNKLKMITNGNAKYFLQDHLGSTVGLTDAGGTITSSASYDSFGNSTNNLTTRYQYTGREKDEFTGLYFYRARWYDANLGRFISEDPIGFWGGDFNLFAYGGGNPINFTDPMGTEVFAILYRSKGKLTVDDYSKHWLWGTDQVKHYEFEVFSGMKGSFCMNSNRCDTAEDEGPIPRGQYLIDKDPNKNSTEPWQQISYRLSRSMNNTRPWDGPFGRPGEYVDITDPFSGETVKRGGFYIHPGTVSQGCITFPKTSKLPSGAPWSPAYGDFDQVMKGTTPYLYKNQKFGGRLVVVD